MHTHRLWFYSNMFRRHVPSKAFVYRLISLRVPFNKRLVAVSIASHCEGSSKRLKSRSMSQINAADGVTGETGAERDHAATSFTEEDTIIHRIHREACEVRRITCDPILSCSESDYKPWIITVTLSHVVCYIWPQLTLLVETAR